MTTNGECQSSSILKLLDSVPFVSALGDVAKSRVVYAALILLLWGLYALWTWLVPPKMGYGSGANNNWSRKINYARPNFKSKHFKLRDVWQFVGSATSVDLEFVRKSPFSSISAKDPATTCPLSGHLIGRQTWQRVASPTSAQRAAQDSLTFDPKNNPNAGDKVFRAQLLRSNGGNPAHANPPAGRGGDASSSVTPEAALIDGWDFFSKLQCEDGHWAGDYGGPLFLLPGMVMVCYLTGFDLGDRIPAMVTYTSNHQQDDGGWGLHVEGPSTVFSTTLNYVALRLLGLTAKDPRCVAARAFIHAHGGAVMNPHWGKFWLAVMGAFHWTGVNPIPPELWCLPTWLPFHPSKMWVHSRLPYLGMSYIYGTRTGLPFSHPMAAALRAELYPPTAPFESVRWEDVRNTVAAIDLYAPHTWIMDAAMWGLRAWEQWTPRFIFDAVRAAGNKFAAEYVDAEDLHTNYICIGPVNKITNMLTVFKNHGVNSEQYARHCARLDDYLWVAEDGMKMQGYNGSQLWDTAFAGQALAAAGPKIVKRYEATMVRIAAYMDASQIKDDVPMRDRFFRTISKGGWPFSTADHGWPIADCTSEGLKTALLVRSLSAAGVLNCGRGVADGMGRVRGGAISADRLGEAVNVILAFHNPDGGWATYEQMRGGAWYEYLNPAEVWGDIMVDYTYTELTSACVQALAAYMVMFPLDRPAQVNKALGQGVQYVRNQQREDGSWYGSWAVCFTYGCWFGAEALAAGGDTHGLDRAPLAKMCAFLLSKQRADGGWGESYLSCLLKTYSACESNAVNTAWALLALMRAQCTEAEAVQRGIRFLIASQTPAGDWAQEGCSGIFNRTCAITYTTYRNVFPLWALAAYCNSYEHRLQGTATAPVLTAGPSSVGTPRRRRTPSATPSKGRRRGEDRVL